MKKQKPIRKCQQCATEFEQKSSNHFKCPNCGAHFTKVISNEATVTKPAVEINAFDVLKQMNQDDEANNTRNLRMSNIVAETRIVKQGGLISMGVEVDVLHQLATEEVFCFLCVVNKSEWQRINGK